MDDYSWYHSGRNLYESTTLLHDSYSAYELSAHTDSGNLTVVLTSDGPAAVGVTVNDSLVAVEGRAEDTGIDP